MNASDPSIGIATVESALATAQHEEAVARQRVVALTERARALRALDHANMSLSRLGQIALPAALAAAEVPPKIPAIPSPVRPARNPGEMQKRIEVIMKHPLATSRQPLAIALCTSTCTLEEAIGVLNASPGGHASEAAPRAQIEARPLDADAIYARRRADREAIRARARQ